MSRYERQFRIGALYHHNKWRFENGSEGRKFFVVLGEPDEKWENYILAKTTSVSKRKGHKPGCQPTLSEFLIPCGELENLSKDTWIQLAGLKEAEKQTIIDDNLNRDLKFIEFLPDDMVGQLVNCVKQLKKDISQVHKEQIKNTYKRWLAEKKGG